jgi:hypothetical protein
MKRRFIVPAFFVVDLEEEPRYVGAPSDREVTDDLRRAAEMSAELIQSVANDRLGDNAALLLDELPTMEVDYTEEFPHTMWDILRSKLVEL